MGNSVDLVSKMLGHANVSTTIKHYLRETASEIDARVCQPWSKNLSEDDRRAKYLQALPDFLKHILGGAGLIICLYGVVLREG